MKKYGMPTLFFVLQQSHCRVHHIYPSIQRCFSCENRSLSSFDIDGLDYIPNYVSKEEESQIMDIIEKNVWSNAIRRRTQYYGPVYYFTRKELPEMEPSDAHFRELYPLSTFQFLIVRLEKFFANENQMPNQCLVNEYVGQQGIGYHVDNVKVFGDTVVGLSLLNASVMSLKHMESGSKKDLLLEPRSLYIFRREARYKWKHGIKTARKLLIPGTFDQYFIRENEYRRISLTFRFVNWDNAKKVQLF